MTPADGDAFLISAISAVPGRFLKAPAKSRKSDRWLRASWRRAACDRRHSTSRRFCSTIWLRMFMENSFSVGVGLRGLSRARPAGLEPDTDERIQVAVYHA